MFFDIFGHELPATHHFIANSPCRVLFARRFWIWCEMRITLEAELGQVVRDRRNAVGMTQEDLASLTGIPQANLSKIERGASTARFDTYLRLCQALGIDLHAEGRG